MLAAPVAVPESATVCGLPAALSTIESVAVLPPRESDAGGVNRMAMLQLALAATLLLPSGHTPVPEPVAEKS
jgi:hypothetical protein